MGYDVLDKTVSSLPHPPNDTDHPSKRNETPGFCLTETPWRPGARGQRSRREASRAASESTRITVVGWVSAPGLRSPAAL